MIGRWGAAVRRVGLTLAMLVVLGACAPEPPASLTRTSHPTTLVGTTWRLVTLQGRQPPGDRDLTITFGRTEIAGEGPCNSFGATYGYLPASGALQVGGLVATKRACVEPARSEFEAVYFRGLGGASEIPRERCQLFCDCGAAERLALLKVKANEPLRRFR